MSAGHTFFSVTGLTKDFGGIRAVDDLCFSVEKGSSPRLARSERPLSARSRCLLRAPGVRRTEPTKLCRSRWRRGVMTFSRQLCRLKRRMF